MWAAAKRLSPVMSLVATPSAASAAIAGAASGFGGSVKHKIPRNVSEDSCAGVNVDGASLVNV